MKHTAVVLALTALTACSSTGPSGPDRVLTLEVIDKADCMMWAFPVPCLRVRESGDEEFHGELMSIEGFTFVWGHRYRLQVAEYTIVNPPADGSSRRWELVRILDDELIPAGTEFPLNTFPESATIRRLDAEHLDMFLGLAVPCGEDCQEMGAAIDAGHRFEMTLRHTGNPISPVAIVEWRSCPATVNPTRCDE